MHERFCNGRNDVSLMAKVDGEALSHFRLREFENRDGLAMVHAATAWPGTS